MSMYDQELVAQVTKQLKESVKHRTVVTENLCSVNNVLTSQAYTKLFEYIDSGPAWSEQETTGYQSNTLRVKIAWDSDTIIEELNDAFESLTPTISNLLGIDSEFLGVTLWKDSKGYYLPWHTDNEMLVATFQIYLNESNNPGTLFKIDKTNKYHECQFKPNTGYIACQHNNVRPLHKLRPVTEERYSLFAIWGKPGSKIKEV